MGRKRVIIGQSEFGIHDTDFQDVIAKIKTAMENGTVVELPLMDGTNRQLNILFNGQLAPLVVIDPDVGPKPTEIPGG